MILCNSEKCNLKQSAVSPCISTVGAKEKVQLLVVGDAPQDLDDCQNELFSDLSSEMLKEVLKQVGFDLKRIAYATIVRCRPTQRAKWGNKLINREPSQVEVKECKHFTLEDISRLNPESIMVLGATAFKAILNLTGITTNRGRIYQYQDIPVMATHHPAQVLRDATFQENFSKDLEFLYRELTEDKIIKEPAEYILCDDLTKVRQTLEAAGEAEEVSFDLETSQLSPYNSDSQIVCVSFSFVERESWILPLYHNQQIFTGKKLDMVKGVIKEIMESPLPKIAQNGKFDIGWLDKSGIKTNNFQYDTMLMRYLISEIPGTHGLDSLAWLYVPEMGGYDQPLEEYKSSHKEADPKRGGSYRAIPWEVLAPYAGMDTDCTLRCKHVMEKIL